MMIFSDMWLLWILAPLYAAWAVYFWYIRKKPQRAALRYSTLQSFSQLRQSWRIRGRGIAEALRLVSILLLLVAMLRPQTGRKLTQIDTLGVDIMLVVDTSGSMRALDLDTDKPVAKRRNRLQVVKDVISTFVQKRPQDQVGMVVFGQEAFTQCPLTLDHGILSAFLEQVDIGMAGDSTAIGQGLGTAINRLKKSQAKSKVIILLTDGVNNAGTLAPKQAAEIAQSFGIKIYAIGAGSRDKAPFIVDSIFGKQVAYEDVQIDEETLKAVAQTTGGAYFRAEDEKALQEVYEQINAMEKTEIKMNAYLEYNEEYPWFVGAALGLLLVEVILLGTWLRKIP